MKPDEDLEFKRKVTFRLCALVLTAYVAVTAASIYLHYRIEAAHREAERGYHG